MYYSKKIWLLIWYIYRFKRIKKNFFFFFIQERASQTNNFFFFFPIYIHNGKYQKLYNYKKYQVGLKLGSFFKTRQLNK